MDLECPWWLCCAFCKKEVAAFHTLTTAMDWELCWLAVKIRVLILAVSGALEMWPPVLFIHSKISLCRRVSTALVDYL